MSAQILMNRRLVYHMKPGRELMEKRNRKLVGIRMREKETIPNRQSRQHGLLR